MYSPKEQKENVSRAIQPVENIQGAAQITDNRGISPAFVALQREGEEESSKPVENPRKLLDRRGGEIKSKDYFGENSEDFKADVDAAKAAIINMLCVYGLPDAMVDGMIDRLNRINVQIVSGEELAYHMIFKEFSDGLDWVEREDLPKKPDMNNYENYDAKKKYVDKYVVNVAGAIPEYTTINAWGGLNEKTVLINGDVVTAGGAHTIVHEIMHLLADVDTVKALRERDLNGDEAINEYISRVATSLYFDEKDANWNTDMNTDGNHDGKTLYGTRLKNDKILNQMQENDGSFIVKLLGYYLGGKEVTSWALTPEKKE